jgi:hypothetical protein
MGNLVTLPDPTKIGGKYIDNGFWQLTTAQARKLCGGKLPTKAGWCKRVAFDGYLCEVHRTQVGSKSVWALMTTATKA